MVNWFAICDRRHPTRKTHGTHVTRSSYLEIFTGGRNGTWKAFDTSPASTCACAKIEGEEFQNFWLSALYWHRFSVAATTAVVEMGRRLSLNCLSLGDCLASLLGILKVVKFILKVGRHLRFNLSRNCLRLL